MQTRVLAAGGGPEAAGTRATALGRVKEVLHDDDSHYHGRTGRVAGSAGCSVHTTVRRALTGPACETTGGSRVRCGAIEQQPSPTPSAWPGE